MLFISACVIKLKLVIQKMQIYMIYSTYLVKVIGGEERDVGFGFETPKETASHTFATQNIKGVQC